MSNKFLVCCLIVWLLFGLVGWLLRYMSLTIVKGEWLEPLSLREALAEIRKDFLFSPAVTVCMVIWALIQISLGPLTLIVAGVRYGQALKEEQMEPD